MSLYSQEEKSPVGYWNNQPDLFDHRVIAHTKAEKLLCDITREEIKRRRTMLEENTGRKPTYPQDWRNYNLAQTTEKSCFLKLLFELCSQIEELPRKERGGRFRIPMRDMIFTLVYKVYSTFSARRIISDLNEAHQKGYISRVPHFNSLFNYLELDEMYGYLKDLITLSASPLRCIEINFAVDSSGFSTGQFTRWLHARYSNPHYRDKCEWLKCHIMCGVSTNIVTSVEITDRNSADCPQFETLFRKTAQSFEINHISGDKAYLSAANLRLVSDYGGLAFIPFKSNSSAEHVSGEAVWRNMYYFYQLHNEKFKEYYHRRSNVESTFSMIKGKFGERLRSKTLTAQINELLCKILCHNICCVIQSMCELGIEANFYRD